MMVTSYPKRSLACVALACALLGAGPATGSLNGTLPAAGVAWVSDGSNPPPVAATVISQSYKAFSPAIMVITQGSTVHFRNDDTVDHSVYSISPADPFDLGIYEPGPGKDVVFAHPGTIAVRCHIHRHMHAELIVVDGPFVKLDAAGSWTLNDVRIGTHVVHTWTEDAGETTRTVTVR